ncbi:MAG: penicillin-binding protein 2 [Firmicutes bacterium]|nr:penicillin-binding protein 2 [Bacillota bacterium]
MKRKQLEIRTRYVLAGVALVFIILLTRISFLQLVQTEQYRTLARNNYIRLVPIFAPRGEIFDRNGAKIVANRPIYTVSINVLNVKGTTYEVTLERIGADTVRMAEQMAPILARDPEYLRLAGGGVKADGEPAANAKLIAEQIKTLVAKHKTELENGRPLVLAAIYNPDVAALLTGQPWDAYGIRVDKQTDMLSRLVALLFPKGVFEEKSLYQAERRIRDDIRGKKAYESLLVAEDVPMETVMELQERQLELPGVVVDVQPIRDYPDGQLLGHVLGYVQNIKSEQYEKHKDEGYLMNDLYGQNGLEIMFENELRGEHGARQVEVDAYNNPVRELGFKQPVPGNDLVLTVDAQLQQAAEKALAEGVQRVQKSGYPLAKGGAAVVLDVNTGAVLAMASYPSYNPGVFANLTTVKWQELQDSGALLNRAISLYPPGSTFKMATLAAVLENNVVDPTYRMADPGYFTLGRRYNDWQAGGHGYVDARGALQHSCDTYFWRYGLAAGQEAIGKYATEFGLGQLTGIGLPGEMAGSVPSPEHKYELVKSMLISYNADFAAVRDYNSQIKAVEQKLAEAGNDAAAKIQLNQEKNDLQTKRDTELNKQLEKHAWDLQWQSYDTLNMAIGQGDNWYTPLQLADYVAAVANGGTLYQPYLVERVVAPNGNVVKEFAKTVRNTVELKPENLKIIQEGMHLVTLPPAGTAAGVFAGFKESAAAKTGTAEVFNAKGVKIGNHAAFVAYAPYEKPEVAVAVFIEFGQAGSGYAGPVGRKILDAYFAEAAKNPLPAGQTGQVNNNGQVAGGQPTGQEQLSDAAPSLVWSDLTEQSTAAPAGADERFRYYEHRLEQWQTAQKAAWQAAQKAAAQRAAQKAAAAAPPPASATGPEPPAAAPQGGQQGQPEPPAGNAPPPAAETAPPANNQPPAANGAEPQQQQPKPLQQSQPQTKPQQQQPQSQQQQQPHLLPPQPQQTQQQ